MKKPDMEKVKTMVGSAIGGAVIIMIIGFSWGGWVLGSTSMKHGERMAQDAVTARLAPICFAQYNQDPEKEDKFNIMKNKYDWEKEEFILNQGWATIPFEEEPDNNVAGLCLRLIMQSNK